MKSNRTEGISEREREHETPIESSNDRTDASTIRILGYEQSTLVLVHCRTLLSRQPLIVDFLLDRSLSTTVVASLSEFHQTDHSMDSQRPIDPRIRKVCFRFGRS